MNSTEKEMRDYLKKHVPSASKMDEMRRFLKAHKSDWNVNEAELVAIHVARAALTKTASSKPPLVKRMRYVY